MARSFLHAVDDMLEAIEIISEASRSIPEDVKMTRSEIPWEKVAAIGNILRHEYHALSDRIIWNVVVDELPKLKIAVLSIRDKFDR